MEKCHSTQICLISDTLKSSWESFAGMWIV